MTRFWNVQGMLDHVIGDVETCGSRAEQARRLADRLQSLGYGTITIDVVKMWCARRSISPMGIWSLAAICAHDCRPLDVTRFVRLGEDGSNADGNRSDVVGDAGAGGA